jgi:hypothetical protein
MKEIYVNSVRPNPAGSEYLTCGLELQIALANADAIRDTTHHANS